MNLFNCIYYLGPILGYRYWRANKFFAANPELLPLLIEKIREMGKTENLEFYNMIADAFQKSFDAWNKKNNI